MDKAKFQCHNNNNNNNNNKEKTRTLINVAITADRNVSAKGKQERN
jgi:hypothetical protein